MDEFLGELFGADENTRKKILSVSQFNEVTRVLLENEPLLQGITLRGEISNYKKYPSGHAYFSLKDERSTIACVMFAGNAFGLRFLPQNGMQVLAGGSATIYGKDGRYQFVVRSMTPDGVGGLYAAFEKLKKRFEEEGLTSESRKKPLPPFPRRVGVITSSVGAAFRDILNVTGRRFPAAEILLYPAAVQGAEAPGQLLQALRFFEAKRNVDVLIIGRGGGSMEDLWAFNDENLCRALADCPIPTISAVGHETDYTLCDFVCDKRAPTPSAAAEMAVPEKKELLADLAEFERRMLSAFERELAQRRELLEQFAGQKVLSDPQAMWEVKKNTLAQQSRRFRRETQVALKGKREGLSLLGEKMLTLNPMAVLTRGYSALFDGEGRVVQSVKSLSSGQKVLLRLADGRAEAEVKKVFQDEAGNREQSAKEPAEERGKV
ncbi:MAG: exodeoxyribonuclease VII large subunit [Clostridiales bacterium]|nr:exodeoxyribonuclease VII large subunit [Clostridiales bacterium]